MGSNDRKLAKAEQAVAVLEARHAARQEEDEVLAADSALLSEQIAAADARGEPTATLEAEREQKQQRRRDLAAVRPLLEQQLAEARAELLTARREVGAAQLAADTLKWQGTGRAWFEEFSRTVLHGPLGAGAVVLLGDLSLLERDDQEVDRLAGKRVRGWTVKDRLIKDTGLLSQMLIAIREWKAGRPLPMAEPRAQTRTAAAPGSVEERLHRASL